jgi:DNA-binding response OmpR family regulator
MFGSWFGSEKRLLLLEDDDAYRYVLARELRIAGFAVFEAKLAMEALEIIEGSPAIRMAVVDMGMPTGTLNGFAFARMMQYRNPGARVVMMTARVDYFDVPEVEMFGEPLLKVSDGSAMAARITARLDAPASSAAQDRAPDAAASPP